MRKVHSSRSRVIPVLLVFNMFLGVVICALIPQGSSDKSVKVWKRDLGFDGAEGPDGVRFPMVISKRSATALGKLYHLLLNARMDHSGGKLIPSSREQASYPVHSANYEMFNLERRNKNSNYLRCYFNAVSCF